MGYAIAAARAKVTPRLLDRPGNEDVWKDLDIGLINHFHNAMVGQGEYLRTPRKETLVVDRGNQGTAIINLGGEFKISTQTNLRSGTYNGEAGVFNVSYGNLTGNIKSGAIVVLYNNTSYGNNNTGNGNGDNNGDTGNGDDVNNDGGNKNKTIIYAHHNVGWGNSLFIRGNTSPLNWNSGIKMTNLDSDTWMWEIETLPQGQKLEFKVLIND